jgi:repressor LexA
MYDRFDQLLQERELTSYRVAKMTGIDASIFSNWKRGLSTPNADNMTKIANALGVSVEYLMGAEKEKPTDEARELSVVEKELMDTFKQLTPERQKLLLSVAASWLD